VSCFLVSSRSFKSRSLSWTSLSFKARILSCIRLFFSMTLRTECMNSNKRSSLLSSSPKSLFGLSDNGRPMAALAVKTGLSRSFLVLVSKRFFVLPFGRPRFRFTGPTLLALALSVREERVVIWGWEWEWEECECGWL